MLSGLIYPTSGSARVAGFDPSKRENAYRRLFALVLGQKNQLWWDLPAIESFNLLRAILPGSRRRVGGLKVELAVPVAATPAW
jgi:ABC-type uncharacterized transport system ATPase subunit